MGVQPEVRDPEAGRGERRIGLVRAALIGLFGLVGTGWAAIPILGHMTSAGFWLFGGAALACFATAFGFYTFRRWAIVLAIPALFGSVILFLAIRAAFRTYPF